MSDEEYEESRGMRGLRKIQERLASRDKAQELQDAIAELTGWRVTVVEGHLHYEEVDRE